VPILDDARPPPRRAAVAIDCADIPSNRIAAGLNIGKLRGTESSDAYQANYASQNEACKRFCPMTLDTAVLQTVIHENLSTGLPTWVNRNPIELRHCAERAAASFQPAHFTVSAQYTGALRRHRGVEGRCCGTALTLGDKPRSHKSLRARLSGISLWCGNYRTKCQSRAAPSSSRSGEYPRRRWSRRARSRHARPLDPIDTSMRHD
jgi:hypothetical protein